jgi:hypothetical protein
MVSIRHHTVGAASLGPVSLGVPETANLSDFDISPPDGDQVLTSLQAGGFGDRSESGAPIDDLQRKIDSTANSRSRALLGPVPQ